MKNWRRARALIASNFVALFCLANSSTSAHGGTVGTVRNVRSSVHNFSSTKPLDAAHVSFEESLSSISNALHVSIIVEGVPLCQEIESAELAALLETARSPNAEVVPIKAISQIAAAFDYDCDAASSGVFLMRKRYTDPDDLPCVTSAEVMHSISGIIAVIDSFSTAPLVEGIDTSSFQFYASLSEADQLKARDGIDVKYADLGMEQKRLALASARQVILDSKTRTLRAILLNLATVEDPRTVVRWSSYGGVSVLAFEGPFGWEGASQAYPLTGGLMFQGSGGAMRPSDQILAQIAPAPAPSIMMAGRADATDIRSRYQNYDPTAPTALDRLLAPGMLSCRIHTTITLEEAAQRVSDPHMAGLRVTVDPSVAQKPVCLYDCDVLPGNELIRDIAKLYGLEVFTADNRNLMIAPPRPHRTHDARDVPNEMSILIPPSLMRSLKSQTNRIAATLPGPQIPPNTTPETREWLERISAESNLRIASIPAAQTNYFPSDRRLIVLAQQKVPSPDSQPVSVSALGPEATRLICLMMLSGVGYQQLSTLKTFVPPRCLLDENKMIVHIRMVQHSGRQSLEAKFGVIGETGEFEPEAGSFFGRSQPK